MRNGLRSNLELWAQIVVAVAVVVVAGVLVKRHLFTGQVNSANVPAINVGEKISIPNIDWAQNEKSLVFFLKKDCAYCTSSAPFYRQLIEEAAKRNVQSIAILPNTVDEARKYLNYIELPIEKIQTAPLSSYKIPGTPTVLFVDSGGTVRSVWIGAVPEREKEMRDKLIDLFEARFNQ